MKFGLSLPIFDELADPLVLAALAAEAEAAGWAGVFVWDHVYYRPPVLAAVDPWMALAAMAGRTSSVRLGPLVTPIARRRPQILARQVASLELLAPGRTVLGVGLGLDSSGGEFVRFGEDPDMKRRRERYDEGLRLVVELLTGESVDHEGAHFTAKDVVFLPRPVQPIPIWVAARWPHRRPWARAARHDGVAVTGADPDGVAEMTAAIADLRRGSTERFDVVVQTTEWRDVARWAAAGATWLIPTIDPFTATVSSVRNLIAEHAS